LEDFTGNTTFHLEHQSEPSRGQQAAGTVTSDGGSCNMLPACWSEGRNQGQKTFRREFLLILRTGSSSKWSGVHTGGTHRGRRLLVGGGEL